MTKINISESFSLSDYIININNKSSYPYLSHDFADVRSLFMDLIRKSELFIRYNLSEEACDNRQVIFINSCDDSQLKKFENQIKDAITDATIVSASSPHKLVMFRMHELDAKEVEL